MRAVLLALLFATGLAGCTGITSRAAGNVPRTGSLVPNTTLQLTPSVGIALEKIIFWGAYAGAAYLVLDPLAPNWEIEEAPLPDNYVHFSLKMRRYYAGGAGEALVVFNRRAKELVQYGGFDAYEVLEYSEGMVSSMLGSQRVCEGVIHLTSLSRKDETPGQGKAPPARITPERVEKPLS